MPLKHEKPSKEYMRELKATAKAAAAFKDDLAKFNMLPDGFPCEQIYDFCDSLIGLPNGTAEGSIAPLRSSDNELNRIRQTFIPAYDEDEGGEPPLIERSSNLDNKLVALMAAVRSAIERYKIESGDEVHTDVSPELSNQPDTRDDKTGIAEDATALESDARDAKTAFENNIGDASRIDTELRLLSDVETGAKSASGAVKTETLTVAVLEWIADGVESTATAIEKQQPKLKIVAEEFGEGCVEQVEIWFPKLIKSGKALYTRMKKLSNRLESEEEQQQQFTPENFDYVEVYNRLLRGEPVPDAWAPKVTELDFFWLKRNVDLHHLNNNDTAKIIGDPETFTDTALLTNLTALEAVNLSGTQIDDCAPLANLTALGTLSLSGTQIDDCAPLANLKALEAVNLSGTQIDDFAPLAKLMALETLRLSGTQIDDCAPLANLMALETLNLIGTKIDDLAPLVNLTALRELYISNTNITDTSVLDHIEGLEIFGL